MLNLKFQRTASDAHIGSTRLTADILPVEGDAGSGHNGVVKAGDESVDAAGSFWRPSLQSATKGGSCVSDKGF